MQFIGGKMRQGKHIAEIVKQLIEPKMAYIEPFCGALGSSSAVAKVISNNIQLSDNQPDLITMWNAAFDGYEFPDFVSEEAYQWQKLNGKDDDPLTAFIAYGCSFGGKKWGGYARNKKGDNASARVRIYNAKKGIVNKTFNFARRPDMMCCDYTYYYDIGGQFLYLDPPYIERTKQNTKNKFNHDEYWDFARYISRNNCVIVTEFVVPGDFVILYNFGDTVVRHHASRGADGTNEVIAMYKDCPWIDKAVEM